MNSLLQQFEKEALALWGLEDSIATVRVDVTNTLTQIEQVRQLEEIARALGDITTVLESIDEILRKD